MRPKYLDQFVAMRALLLLAGFAFVGTGALPLAQALSIAIPFCVICLAIDWVLWCGHNWARVLTIALSLLSVSGVQYLPSVTILQQILILTDALFSAALVYWLFRPHVRGYFKPQPAAV